MGRSRAEGILAGLVAGFAGVAVSELVASALALRESPVVAFASTVFRLPPGSVDDPAMRLFGGLDKPLLVLATVGLVAGAFGLAGSLGRTDQRESFVVYLALTGLSAAATLSRSGARPADLWPTVASLVTWVVMLRLVLKAPEHESDADASRRAFLRRAGLVAVGAAVAAAASQVISRGRRRVLEQRRLLRLPGVTDRPVPSGADLKVEGAAPWQTPAWTFFRVDTAVVPPAVDVDTWTLRIHGMVDRPLTISFADLLSLPRVEDWVALSCVSNPVGGNLIGNAWWSGVLTRSLLAEVGVREGATAVKQTSQDGWTCGTPLAALTDSRDALLAVAMNGDALPLEHGFPVRTVVPGLYGFVSACKWVVDWEVTTFDRFQAFWTRRGWAEQAPVKLGSRIDVPRDGQDVPAGSVVAAGVAWHQRVGVRGVEVSLDGGPWEPAELGHQVSADTWVQWRRLLDVAPGDHELRVRAVGADGESQTPVPADPVPNGVQGWHEVRFTATG